MSNFQDNFHREEETHLDYDDSAFYYFFISLLTVLLLPYTLYLIKQMITGEKKIELEGKNCECSRCQELIRKRQQVYKKTWIRFGFFIKLIVVGLLWYVWYLTAHQISQIKPLKSFDPFQILGVDPSADTSTIKKAFRKLSLIKHPDKNPNDPIAATEFIQITKAYNALTDETARQNWEKYGNPDGPGSFHVAIALPRFLLQKEYQVQVLGGFFFVLLILIPGYFYVNLDKSQIDIGGVHVDNRKIYAYLINENLILKMCPALLANSIELRQLKVKTQEEAKTLSLIKQNDEIKELVPKLTSKRGQQLDMKALILILGYLMRCNDINDSVKEDLDFILAKAPYHIDLMIQMAIILGFEFKMGRSRKRITAKNVLTLLEFSQNIVQALWKDDDPFLQLPHMDDDKIKQLRKKRKSITIEEFCKMSKEERKELQIFEKEQELQDVEKAVKSFPLVDLRVEYFVDGEKEIAVGDLLTVKIIITQLNIGEKEQAGFVHSNKYPFLKQNQWYLIFTDREEADFLAMEKLPIRERVFVKEIKDPMRQPGKITMNVLLRNDSYKGFDKQVKIEIDVLKEVQRSVVEYNDEDIQAAKQPSLMQQVMEMQPHDSSDEEEEEEDEVKTSPLKNHEHNNCCGETKKDQ